MKIDIYCSSICRDENEASQISGGGVYLSLIDPYNREITRSFRYGFGCSNSLVASIKVVTLGLSSIKAPYRKWQTTLHTDNDVLRNSILTKNIDIPSPEFDELIKWYSYYHNIQTVLETSSDNMAKAKNLAEVGMINQENYDSGTVT
jgi:hypothetical protein